MYLTTHDTEVVLTDLDPVLHLEHIDGTPLNVEERLTLGMRRRLDDLFALTNAGGADVDEQQFICDLVEAQRVRAEAHGGAGLASMLFNDIVDPVSITKRAFVLGFEIDTLEDDLVARIRTIAPQCMSTLAADIVEHAALPDLLRAAHRLRDARRRGRRRRGVYAYIKSAVEKISGAKTTVGAVRKAIERR